MKNWVSIIGFMLIGIAIGVMVGNWIVGGLIGIGTYVLLGFIAGKILKNSKW